MKNIDDWAQTIAVNNVLGIPNHAGRKALAEFGLETSIDAALKDVNEMKEMYSLTAQGAASGRGQVNGIEPADAYTRRQSQWAYGLLNRKLYRQIRVKYAALKDGERAALRDHAERVSGVAKAQAQMEHQAGHAVEAWEKMACAQAWEKLEHNFERVEKRKACQLKRDCRRDFHDAMEK